MKFAALLPHVGVYGGVRRFLALGNELIARGHELAIVHPEGTPPAWMPFRGRTLGIDAALAERFDVALCGDPGVFEPFARVRAERKVLFLLGPRYADKVRAARTPDMLVVGVNEDWREWMPGVPGHTVAGGIDLDAFPRRRPDEAPAEGDGAPFRVLGFGRVEKKVKGARYLLSAMRRLGRGVRLVLYDNAPVRLPWTARLFLDVEAHVGLDQAALAALYRSAHAFVSAEISGGWSNPVAEAMASGVPVVCTRVGTAALARDGETALVVPVEDAAALAAALGRLRTDPDLGHRLADAARRRVEDFSWSNTCERLLDVLGAGRPADPPAAPRLQPSTPHPSPGVR